MENPGRLFRVSRSLAVASVLACALTQLLARGDSQSLAPKAFVDVAVWDSFFNTASVEQVRKYFDGSRNGVLAGSFFWDQATEKQDEGLEEDSVGNKSHGFKTSFVIADGQPFVRIHPVFNEYLPWQDPEKCRLVEMAGFDDGLPDCRDAAERGISRLSGFLRDNSIKVLNLSGGTYYPNYALHGNRDALRGRFPGQSPESVDKFLLSNFMAIGGYVNRLISENPQVLFVFAAGNEPNLDVDQQKFPDWDERHPGQAGLPIWYASIAEKHSNSIAVTSGSPDVDPANSAFLQDSYGRKSVSFAVRNTGVTVPDGSGTEIFRGTSSSAAKMSKLFARAIYLYSRHTVDPRLLKEVAQASVDRFEALKPLLVTGGVLNEKLLFANLARKLGSPDNAYTAPPPPPTVHSSELSGQRSLQVEARADRAFREYPFHLKDRQGRPTGCLIARVDAAGQVWMTLPDMNQIGRLDPASGELKTYDVPTDLPSDGGPDGLAIDSSGRVWVGEYQSGKLLLVDPNRLSPGTGQPLIREFTPEPAMNMAIPAADGRGNIWITSHQPPLLYQFDIGKSAFAPPVELEVGWPLDVLVDEGGRVWVSGNTDFKLGNSRSGALVEYNPATQALDYYGLPQDPRSSGMSGLWLAQGRNDVYMTLGKDGILDVDKHNGYEIFLEKATGDQYFYTAASLPARDEVAFSDEAGGVLTLNVLDGGGKLLSYRLPTQKGQFAEGLTYDSRNGDLWYCQQNPPILGVLKRR